MKILISIYLFIIGSVFSSFFGVVIDRIPKKLSIIKPASRCDNCGHVLKWYENIPVFSYLFLKGKCLKCGTKIGIFSFIYEVIGGISLMLIYLAKGLSVESILMMLITLVILLIAGYDYKTHEVTNFSLIILTITCLGLFLYRVIFLNYDFRVYLYSLISSIIFFILLRFIMNKILKKDSLGTGDIYLIGILSIIYEPFELILSIAISSLIGCIIAFILIGTKHLDKDSEIAFCPFLSLGFYIVLVYGNIFIDLLLR